MRRHIFSSVLGVFLLLIFCPAGEAERLYTYKTAHYVIETDVSPEYAARIGELMEILYQGYLRVFRGLKPRLKGLSTVRIRKFKSDYVDREYGNPHSGGYYMPGALKVCSFLEKNESYLVNHVLPHEGFHQFFDKYIGETGLWVNEGLAQFFEHSLIDGTEIKFGLVTKPGLEHIQKTLNSSDAMSLKELLFIDSDTWHANMANDPAGKGRIQYAESRFLVHFLVLAEDGRYQKNLNAYLMALKQGLVGERALGASFGRNWKVIDDAWRKYTEEMKPCVPESCTAHLTYLANLLKIYYEAGEKVETIQELYEKAMAKKLTGWWMLPRTLDESAKITDDDVDIIKGWFTCPSCVQSSRRRSTGTAPQVSYTLEQPWDEDILLPTIVCRNHGKKLMIVARFVESEKEKVVPLVENVRYKKPRAKRK